MPRSPRSARTHAPLPVIGITGYLGAGKTTLLNHLLRVPGARVGVIINDFGAINVDAALVAGQIDEAVAITGGCVCCLPDAGGIEPAIAKLADPALRLDAILVEASGVAEPLAFARMLRAATGRGTRYGGMIEVLDAVAHDQAPASDVRHVATTLAVLSKTDLLPPGDREAVIAQLTGSVQAANPAAAVVPTRNGAIDPALVFDAASVEDPADELPIAALFRAAAEEAAQAAAREEAAREAAVWEEADLHGSSHGHRHAHAGSAAIELPAPVTASALRTLLIEPPPGAFRIKGRVSVRGPRSVRRLHVNVVAGLVHLAAAPGIDPALPPETNPLPGELVLIGPELDVAEAQRRLAELAERPPAEAAEEASAWAALQRLQRLSSPD